MGTVGARCDHDARFVHEAVFYAGEHDFVAQILPFLREGVAAGEPALVAVRAGPTRRLREGLGADAARVQFAEMETLGRNPGRIISAWHDFVAAHEDAGRRVRGVGEPIWPGRSEAELGECHRHEALLNVAFDGGPPWRLLCPYDVSTLSADVVAEARRTHPVVREDGSAHASDGFPGPLTRAPLAGALPEPAGPVIELQFGADDLARVRRVVAERAGAAGLERARNADLVLCVSELAANSVRHGGGTGVLRSWTDGAFVVCEVRDRGALDEPLTGRIRPAVDAHGGRGVWFANALCDLVQIRSQADGTVVRVHMQLAA